MSSDRGCPAFISRCEKFDKQFPENCMPYFPTKDHTTWATAPPKCTTPPFSTRPPAQPVPATCVSASKADHPPQPAQTTGQCPPTWKTQKTPADSCAPSCLSNLDEFGFTQHLPTAPGTLRIWQHNVHKSSTAQADVLAVACPKEWDVLTIQEPYLDFLGNSRASSYWRVLYPSDHRKDGSTHSCSVLLINTNNPTDAFTQLTIHSTDITAIRFAGEFGFLSLFNVYNDCKHNEVLTTLSSFLSSSAHIAHPSASDCMLWLGDFNHHHPLWEPVDNHHLNSPKDFIQPLLDMLTAYDMELALPPGIPTLQTASDRWTRPNNIWRSHTDVDPIISCDVVPSLRPMHADHLPIVTEVKLPVQHTSLPPSKDFHSMDWTAFNEALTERLSTRSPALPILTEEAFDTKVRDLTLIIQEIMNIDDIVPIRKPCPHTKRWFRDIPDHPAKAEAARLSRKMADAIQSAKESHWKEWLENIDVQQIYTANKYVVCDPSDFSCDRVPSLKTSVDGMPSMATTNAAKGEALAESFFPPPPPSPSILLSAYPRPLPASPGLSRDCILVAIGNLPPFKAPGPDGIPNIVLKQCANVLVDHLFFIFAAVFELEVYHPSWLESTTLVLRKPGKPAYNVAKAYRPIGLLNTIGKLFSTMVAADISYLAEKYRMLLPGQFGGWPGRNTTDAMHLVVSRIKDAWCSGNVVTALFLDVQGAFPNTVKDCLIHNMRERGVPTCYVQLAECMLTGQRTKLRFDDFISDWISITNGTTQGCPLSMLYYTFYNAPLIQAACLNSKSELTSGFVDDVMFLAMAKSLTETHEIIRDIMERSRGAFKWSLLYHLPFELSKLALMDFPHSHWDAAPPNIVLRRANLDSSVTAQMVDTVTSYKYLGVVFDPKLRWTAHLQKVAASAAWWTHQISRLSRISGGMPPHCVRQLYNTVAIPAFTYAADIWYTGVCEGPKGAHQMGSLAVTKKIAGDVLDAHANLLPVDLLFHKVLTRAAVCFGSLPDTHPVGTVACRAAKRFVHRHRSPLHNLFLFTGVNPSSIEIVRAHRCCPNYWPAFTTHIASSKEEALEAIRLTHDCASTAIYCNSPSIRDTEGPVLTNSEPNLGLTKLTAKPMHPPFSFLLYYTFFSGRDRGPSAHLDPPAPQAFVLHYPADRAVPTHQLRAYQGRTS
ncbi:hypothetical protein E4T56_gene5479 [Termitomyces sp. T112]|nr:hypothetical protein E4T56_gene5479 [Termitomyces sp. T112]